MARFLLWLAAPWLASLVRGQTEGKRGKPECWTGALTYEACCLPPPDGNPICWDAYFTAAYCCSDLPLPAAPPSPLPPPLSLPATSWAEAEGAEEEAGGRGRGMFGGCEWNFFQGFKLHAASWYSQKKAPLSLYHEFNSIARQFDDVYESCPPAALTAFLLKMESVYYDEDIKFYDLLDIYINREHRAVSEGTLLQSHHRNGWPLLPGLSRLLQLRAHGRRAEEKPSERPTVDVVICYCAERLVWLRAFHKIPWREEDRSTAMRRHVALRIYHKCGGATLAERDAERKRLLQDWGGYFRSVDTRFVDDVVRADDCSAYLAYIADNYDDLPDYTVFLHADAPEHIPSLELLTETVFAASRGYLPEETGFAHLAHNHVLHHVGCENGGVCEARTMDGFEFPTMWKNVFGSSIAPSLAAGELNAYCCVQFLVKRERIQMRPRSFYQRALDYFGGSAQSYYDLFPAGKVVRPSDALGRTPCQLAMYIWHVMFGEPLALPRRQRDPSLPFFMKLFNIEVEVLNDEAGTENDVFIEQVVAHSEELETGPLSTAARVQSLFDPGYA